MICISWVLWFYFFHHGFALCSSAYRHLNYVFWPIMSFPPNFLTQGNLQRCSESTVSLVRKERPRKQSQLALQLPSWLMDHGRCPNSKVLSSMPHWFFFTETVFTMENLIKFSFTLYRVPFINSLFLWLRNEWFNRKWLREKIRPCPKMWDFEVI